jgi:aspartate oxidase
MRQREQLRELRDDPYPLAAAIATCALQRAESRGGHLRADCPSIDPELDSIHIVFGSGGETRREEWR